MPLRLPGWHDGGMSKQRIASLALAAGPCASAALAVGMPIKGLRAQEPKPCLVDGSD